jgi:hypothetical protein
MNQSLTGNYPMAPSCKSQNYVPYFLDQSSGGIHESFNGISATVRALLNLLEVGEYEAEDSNYNFAVRLRNKSRN